MVYTILTGPLETNTYIFEKNGNALVIDPAGDSSDVISLLNEKKLLLKGVVATHGHLDHVAGVKNIINAFSNSFFAIHSADRDATGEEAIKFHNEGFASFPDLFKQYWNFASPVPRATKIVENNEIIEDFNLKVLCTPGHTKGSISLYSEEQKILFAGDTLFKNGVGRTDLAGGNYSDIINSIKTRLFVLPDETIVYPGHGASTTIGNEKKSNPFLT